jgi:toxin-antitoxin system PIN domain toxin
MRPYLLDTNVLLALAWPNHVHHGEATEWFLRKAASGFRTCPITQTGFIRISSNPSFTANAVTPSEAMALLDRITRLPGHGFWPDDLGAAEAFAALPMLGTHRQVTDAYLLSLAAAHDGVLATLDRGIAALARQYPERLELVHDLTMPVE